jgi:16S rRNA (guanine527-N7)-methyltransferase
MLERAELELLAKGAVEFGLDLSSRQLEQFSKFTDLLLEWNRKFNLTRITESHDIVVKHLLDSLSCFGAAQFPLDTRVVDVGSGAGFPGIPMEIARPDLNITLLDSTRKRLVFAGTVAKELGLSLRLVHARAEEAGQDIEHREYYRIAVARAVARLNELAEYCLPLVKVGGFLIAQKGPEALEESSEAQHSVKLLGGDVEKIVRLTLPGSDIVRNLVVVKKVSPTPAAYPRRSAQIQREPL